MSFKILVMSCDKNADLFDLFYYCMEKYWPTHPEIVYSTEQCINPYYKTICKNYPLEQYTRRLRETAKEIDCKNLLVMMDDTFIRKPVNAKLLNKLTTYINNYMISINLEPPRPFKPIDLKFNEILNIRHPSGRYHSSLQPQIWNKEKLIELFSIDCNPWEAEKLGDESVFTFGNIATSNIDFDYGKIPDKYPFSLVQGKWTKEVKDFFDKEGLKIDYEKRGFINE